MILNIISVLIFFALCGIVSELHQFNNYNQELEKIINKIKKSYPDIKDRFYIDLDELKEELS